MTSAINTFLNTHNFTQDEKEYLQEELNIALQCGWDCETIENIKNHFDNKETQYCFTEYAYNKPFAKDLLNKVISILV